MCTITAADVSALSRKATLDTQRREWLEYSWIHLRSFGSKDCLLSNFQHIKTE